MRLTVQSRINVSGQWWDIETEHSVSDELSPVQKISNIEGVILGLVSTGKIISRVGGAMQLPFPETELDGPSAVRPEPGAAFTWPSPNCKVHRVDMTKSNTQKEEGHIQYYCTKRIGEGYCRQRAKVNMKTGHPNFWEVKE